MSKICFIELHNVYFLSNILTLIKSTNLKWTGHIARMEKGRNSLKTSTGKWSLGRPKLRLKGSIRIDFEGIHISD